MCQLRADLHCAGLCIGGSQAQERIDGIYGGEQGIARALLRAFRRFAEENRLAFLTLEVRASNAPAIALYAGEGYREAGRRKNYYRHPMEDAIIMTLEFHYDTDHTDP